MSFGFSIGDIVLLSQLAFKLYSSVTSGRKAASRDLKELEDVLFSLKCSLDHLGDAAKDISARASSGQAGSSFKENLDRMIASCGTTLQELDTVTKKYRELGIDPDVEEIKEKVDERKRKFEDVKHGLKVNWRKVRWDQEKKSLQEYREKLKSHCDAVNLILTTSIWADTTQANANNTTHHEKTHGMLEDVLKNARADDSFQKMIGEIHAVLTTPAPPGQGYGHIHALKAVPGLKSAPAPAPAPAFQQQPMDGMIPTYSSGMMHTPFDFGKPHMGVALSASADATLQFTPENAVSKHAPESQSIQTSAFAYSAAASQTTIALPYRLPKAIELPRSTIELNHKRKALGAKQFADYKARQQNKCPTAPPQLPSFLTSASPTLSHLLAGTPYIFASLASGTLELQQRSREINQWTAGFSSLVQSQAGANSEQFVDVLVALNEGVEKSEKNVQRLFYQVVDMTGLMGALDVLLSVSKSVRVMKEVEEFQDVREEFEEG